MFTTATSQILKEVLKASMNKTVLFLLVGKCWKIVSFLLVTNQRTVSDYKTGMVAYEHAPTVVSETIK